MTAADRAGADSPEVAAAVERALGKQRDDAARDVEAILDATLRVSERVAPAAPRVADIVAEAGSSNQAFYRYFGGKEELMRAVYLRGLTRLHGYLEHQMAKAAGEPGAQVEAWVRGVLTQAADRTAARQSAAIVRQMGDRAGEDAEHLEQLRALLRDAVARTGSRHVNLDTDAVFDLTFGALRRHVDQGTTPSRAECAHLVRFCRLALGPGDRC